MPVGGLAWERGWAWRATLGPFPPCVEMPAPCSLCLEWDGLSPKGWLLHRNPGHRTPDPGPPRSKRGKLRTPMDSSRAASRMSVLCRRTHLQEALRADGGWCVLHAPGNNPYRRSSGLPDSPWTEGVVRPRSHERSDGEGGTAGGGRGGSIADTHQFRELRRIGRITDTH